MTRLFLAAALVPFLSLACATAVGEDSNGGLGGDSSGSGGTSSGAGGRASGGSSSGSGGGLVGATGGSSSGGGSSTGGGSSGGSSSGGSSSGGSSSGGSASGGGGSTTCTGCADWSTFNYSNKPALNACVTYESVDYRSTTSDAYNDACAPAAPGRQSWCNATHGEYTPCD